MKQLMERHRQLLAVTDICFVRYLHEKIAWNARMIGIVGARGAGKTTLPLQHLLLKSVESRKITNKSKKLTMLLWRKTILSMVIKTAFPFGRLG